MQSVSVCPRLCGRRLQHWSMGMRKYCWRRTCVHCHLKHPPDAPDDKYACQDDGTDRQPLEKLRREVWPTLKIDQYHPPSDGMQYLWSGSHLIAGNRVCIRARQSNSIVTMASMHITQAQDILPPGSGHAPVSTMSVIPDSSSAPPRITGITSKLVHSISSLRWH